MPTPLRVLFVEDSEDDAPLMVDTLNQGGFEVTWERVWNADSMKAALATRTWDIIIVGVRRASSPVFRSGSPFSSARDAPRWL